MSNQQLIEQASGVASICFKLIEPMADDCLLVTDSGGRKRYVIGALHNGKVFVERATALEARHCSA